MILKAFQTTGSNKFYKVRILHDMLATFCIQYQGLVPLLQDTMLCCYDWMKGCG